MGIYEGAPCPVCEKSKLMLVKKTTEFSYKGRKKVIENYLLACDVCGESFFQPKDERNLDKMLQDERRKIDGLLTSEEIKKIRSKFRLTQIAFAKRLGLSDKVFARYESGQSNQSMAVDDLLRVLDAYPDAIREIPIREGRRSKGMR